MNQSLLLHVVERLETLVGKLPASLQKPILSELTPMKELFLQQRAPRLLFTGSDKTPVLEIIRKLFPGAIPEDAAPISTVNRWHDFEIADRGTISILDARSSEESSSKIRTELKLAPADVIFFVNEAAGARKTRSKGPFDNLEACLEFNQGHAGAKIIGLMEPAAKMAGTRDILESDKLGWKTELQSTLQGKGGMNDRLAGVYYLSGAEGGRGPAEIWSLVARDLPNQARIEMARISKDRAVQADIAQILVKSTTAICTAIGTQPIPLADLPILTTLQLVMVSGIMYISGRERSLRAATEFVAALGVNVGAGMLLREGTRAILKFFPGWGNVICGMVAGAGTYAMGRAAIVFFLEGVSIKDARRTYLTSRKKSASPRLLNGASGAGAGKRTK